MYPNYQTPSSTVVATWFSRTSLFAAFVVAVSLPSVSVAQKTKNSDVKEYLARIDRNRNGVLETDEMVGRSSRFLKGLGFDTNRPIRLSKVLAKLNKDQGGASSKSEVVRKVPGFGVDPEEKEGVATFATGGRSEAKLQQKYGSEIMVQVQGVLDRYDKDKNGVLSSNEIKKANWGRPTPQESDLNRDVSLTKSELANRYLIRKKEELAQENKRQSRAGRSSKSSRSSGFNKIAVRPPTNVKVKTSKSVANAPSSTKSNQERYERYANGLIKQYDKNKDGKLDKKEFGEMRRPPKGADANGDGIVTKQELTNVLSGKTSPVAPKATQTSSSSSRKSRDRSYSSKSSRSRSKSVSLADNDTNGDGQLQMHEYAENWDQSVVSEFDRIDKNKDGTITPEEWAQKDR